VTMYRAERALSEGRSTARTRLLILIAASLLPLAAARPVAAAPLDYDEVVEGDLSGDNAAPTLLVFAVGDNRVSGSMGASDVGFDPDLLSFEVLPGQLLTSIDLLVLEPDSTVGTGIFTAIAAGGSIDPFDASQHLGNALVASTGSVLPLLAAGTIFGAPGFDAPLGPGRYTFWIQETSTRVDYALAFQVVPEPGTATVLAAGLGAIAVLRSRRA
jgi:hypothetical protein